MCIRDSDSILFHVLGTVGDSRWLEAFRYDSGRNQIHRRGDGAGLASDRSTERIENPGLRTGVRSSGNIPDWSTVSGVCVRGGLRTGVRSPESRVRSLSPERTPDWDLRFELRTGLRTQTPDSGLSPEFGFSRLRTEGAELRTGVAELRTVIPNFCKCFIFLMFSNVSVL